tara:strand:+ start:844 stop:1908 length:1065 start_codon:yes stop_codon:yes gene_type:complete
MNVKKETLIILIFIVFTIIIYEVYILHRSKERGGIIPDVNWPFLNFFDEKDRKVNILCIRGPLQTDNDIKMFRKYKQAGFKFIGCSSYLSFPFKCNNPSQIGKGGVCYQEPLYEGKRIDMVVDGWLHCFRPDRASKILNDNKLLLSESDFMDSIEILRHFNTQRKKYRYDFICYCPLDPNGCDKGWHFYNKNWPLAKKTIEILCNSFNMKGILIGREKCPLNIKNKDNLIMKDWLEYNHFLKTIADSKFMLISSLEDASPRTIGESLLLNTPILVNQDIIGGWKYVNSQTGLFFNKNNIEEKIHELLENLNNYSPRNYYLNNHGIYHSGKLLRDFLVKIKPDLSKHKYIRFAVS